MKIRFLGTGTSVGVPQIGCDCPTCTSPDPRDRRNRCGLHVLCSPGRGFLVDTPPEMRLACANFKVRDVESVLITHAHMDHIAGFDDVRRFNTINGETVPCDPNSPGANGRTFRIIGKPMNCYALPETIEQMHRIFPYISSKGGENGLFRPQINFTDNTSPFSVCGIDVESLKVDHGGFPCCGYLMRDPVRGKSAAYIPDCHVIPDDVIAKLRGVDLMILNCLRVRQHPTHLTFERSLAYMGQIAPRQGRLVHMCHDFTQVQWLEKLAGTNIRPAFDGEEIEI